MENSHTDPEVDISQGRRIIKMLMTQRVLHKVNSIDARSMTELQHNGLLDHSASINPADIVVDVICDTQHVDRIDIPPGPMLFYCEHGETVQWKVVRVVDLLFSTDYHVRAKALSHFLQLQNSGECTLSLHTDSILATEREALSSNLQEQWKPAAIHIYDAIDDDFFCNLAGLRQCLSTHFDVGLEDYLPRVLTPNISSLDALKLEISKPSAQRNDIENIISQCADGSSSLCDACSVYYSRLGYLPFSDDLSMGQLIVKWMDVHQQGTLDCDELWLWAENTPSPLPRYHLCVALTRLSNLLSEQQTLRLLDEIRFIINIDSVENEYIAQWSLWCKLAIHYTHHLDYNLPYHDGEKICNLAWWVAEQVASVTCPHRELAKQFFEDIVNPLCVASELIWHIADPHIASSSLRYATYYTKMLWSTALQCSIGLPYIKLSQQFLQEYHLETIFEALSTCLFDTFPLHISQHDKSVYAFDHDITSIVEQWVNSIEDAKLKSALSQLLIESKRFVDPSELILKLKDIVDKSESDQIFISKALRVMVSLDQVLIDDVWNCVGNADWYRRSLLNIKIPALTILSDAFRLILARSCEPWRSQLPHIYAYGCEITSGDSERQSVLFMETMLSSMNADTVSAINRLLKGSQRDEFTEFITTWEQLLRITKPRAPAWVADRMRVTIASLHV
ncbi:MAG: hypothetical protein ACYC1M_14510 [Armatimonadota bacterium]